MYYVCVHSFAKNARHRSSPIQQTFILIISPRIDFYFGFEYLSCPRGVENGDASVNESAFEMANWIWIMHRINFIICVCVRSICPITFRCALATSFRIPNPLRKFTDHLFGIAFPHPQAPLLTTHRTQHTLKGTLTSFGWHDAIWSFAAVYPLVIVWI